MSEDILNKLSIIENSIDMFIVKLFKEVRRSTHKHRATLCHHLISSLVLYKNTIIDNCVEIDKSKFYHLEKMYDIFNEIYKISKLEDTSHKDKYSLMFPYLKDFLNEYNEFKGNEVYSMQQ